MLHSLIGGAEMVKKEIVEELVELQRRIDRDRPAVRTGTPDEFASGNRAA